MEKKMNFEPQCKTKADVHREWARVLDMCEGTDIAPHQCLKFDGMFLCGRPLLDNDEYHYEFAIAIVEGKPVFRGDVLYSHGGIKIIALAQLNDEIYKHCSWNPPSPKTFSIQNFSVPDVQWHIERCGGKVSLHLEYKDSKQALAVESKILEVFSQLNI